MAHTVKTNRVWVKQEKQIVKLLYKKGFLDTLNPIEIEDLYWAEFKRDTKKYKLKDGTKWLNHLPEIYFCTCDYWGEYDEHAVVDNIIENLIWDGISENTLAENSQCNCIWLSKFKYKGRRWFIKYLKSLPTKRCDCQINKILYYNQDR